MSEDWCSELCPFLTMFLNIEYLNKSDFICSSVFYKLFPILNAIQRKMTLYSF